MEGWTAAAVQWLRGSAGPVSVPSAVAHQAAPSLKDDGSVKPCSSAVSGLVLPPVHTVLTTESFGDHGIKD